MSVGVVRKLASKKLERLGDNEKWLMIQGLEKVYAKAGKFPSAELVALRAEVIAEFKAKGFLCRAEGCECKAKANGFCEEHNPLDAPTETDMRGH